MRLGDISVEAVNPPLPCYGFYAGEVLPVPSPFVGILAGS
jgi:hypothetical protein